MYDPRMQPRSRPPRATRDDMFMQDLQNAHGQRRRRDVTQDDLLVQDGQRTRYRRRQDGPQNPRMMRERELSPKPRRRDQGWPENGERLGDASLPMRQRPNERPRREGEPPFRAQRPNSPDYRMEESLVSRTGRSDEGSGQDRVQPSASRPADPVHQPSRRELYAQARKEDNTQHDLSKLERLDEDTILQEVHKRFTQKQIYTYVGDVTIAVNPFKTLPIYNTNFHRKFMNIRTRNDVVPHIYWVAERSYQRMLESGSHQSILISGESGAGKTESTRHIIQHLAYRGRPMDQEPPIHHTLSDKLIAVNPLLEAFGNARTMLNKNSSRFGKYIEIRFTKKGAIKGARIFDYMLEKSRVIHHSQGERNFRIFYYLLAGLTSEELDFLKLRDFEHYKIMFSPEEYENPNRRLYPSEQAWKACREQMYELMRQMQLIGITHEEINFIKTVLCSILHLTSITFEEQSEDYTDGVAVTDTEALSHAARLLGLQAIDLETVLTKSTFGRDNIQQMNSMKQACDARDALAKALYQRLFGWLVGRINQHLSPQGGETGNTTIGVLDMSGFENFKRNSLEQLLINVANERLQFFFNEHLFSQEIEAMKREDIDWTKIHYQNNLNIIDLFFGSSKTSRPGMLNVINEQTALSQATDEQLVQEMHAQMEWNEHYMKPPGNTPDFTVQHFAGNVKYNVRGFLEKNRDGLTTAMLMLMQASSSPTLSSMFSTKVNPTGSISRGGRHSVISSLDSRTSSNASYSAKKKKVPTATLR